MWLVKFEASWADEFEIYGFRLLTDAQKIHWDNCVAERFNMLVSWSFGTNEGFEDVAVEEFAEWFTFSELSDDDGNAIKNLFSYEFGHFPYLPDLIEEVGEDW